MADRRKDKYALFGLKSKTIPHYRRDLLKINNVLDVCFLRDENQNVPYLVISANLKPVFRKQLAREIIKVIQYKMLTTEKT